MRLASYSQNILPKHCEMRKITLFCKTQKTVNAVNKKYAMILFQSLFSIQKYIVHRYLMYMGGSEKIGINRKIFKIIP